MNIDEVGSSAHPEGTGYLPAGVERDLSKFTGAGFADGRSFPVQVAWYVVLNTVFVAWWCPSRMRVLLLRAFGATVGDRVLIRHRVRVKWPWKLSIGNDVWIGEGTWLLNSEDVTIEDDVCVSQEVLICDGSHDPRDPAFELLRAPIRLRQGCWIASRAVVLRGVTVGSGAVVGAGTVVRKDYGAAIPSAPTDPTP